MWFLLFRRFVFFALLGRGTCVTESNSDKKEETSLPRRIDIPVPIIFLLDAVQIW